MLIYLVRHGEADYSHMSENGFVGFGRDFAPLSEKGIVQAEAAAMDERLAKAEIIVSSPYTRALQTAAIISRRTGIRLVVDTDLHEWMPDRTNRYTSSEEAIALTKEFFDNKGVYPEGQPRWETLEEMRVRMRRAADRYSCYGKVIFTGHSMAFGTLKHIVDMRPAEIAECEYYPGREDCEYYFG